MANRRQDGVDKRVSYSRPLNLRFHYGRRNFDLGPPPPAPRLKINESATTLWSIKMIH